MPTTCGNYYIGAIVDPTDYHDESNEGNNSRAGNQMVAGKITVTSPNNSGITWYKSSQQTVKYSLSRKLIAVYPLLRDYNNIVP